MTSNPTLPLLLCLTIVTLLALSGCDSQSGNGDPIADKQVRFDFNHSFAVTTSPNIEGTQVGEKIFRFNISNYVGVDSAVFFAKGLRTEDSGVPAVLELQNATDGETITSVQTTSTSFVEKETTGFLENFPDKTITLTVVLHPESDGTNVSARGRMRLFLYRNF